MFSIRAFQRIKPFPLYSRFCLAFVLFVSASISVSAHAEASASPSIAVFGRVILGLIVVTGFILLLAWAAKRMGYAGTLNNRNMRVLGNLPLGPREKAILVEVNGQQMLLGVGGGSVSNLFVFDMNKVAAVEAKPFTSAKQASAPNDLSSVDSSTEGANESSPDTHSHPSFVGTAPSPNNDNSTNKGVGDFSAQLKKILGQGFNKA